MITIHNVSENVATERILLFLKSKQMQLPQYQNPLVYGNERYECRDIVGGALQQSTPWLLNEMQVQHRPGSNPPLQRAS
jgi:hypothetical protein